MPERIEVYTAIDSERDYQDMRRSRDNGAPCHTVEEFVLYIDHYLNEVKKTASTVWGSECRPAMLEGLRKVVALGVAAMEQHGAPQRKGFEREVPFATMGLYWEGEEPSQGAGVPYDKRGPHGFDIDGLA